MYMHASQSSREYGMHEEIQGQHCVGQRSGKCLTSSLVPKMLRNNSDLGPTVGPTCMHSTSCNVQACMRVLKQNSL